MLPLTLSISQVNSVKGCIVVKMNMTQSQNSEAWGKLGKQGQKCLSHDVCHLGRILKHDRYFSRYT